MTSNSAATPTGEQLSALAYALPPIAPRGLGLSIVVSSIVLGIITTIVVGLRVWVRTGLAGAIERTWGIDDYLVVIGFLPFPPSIAFAVRTAHYGTGAHDADLPTPLYQMRAAEYIIYWEVLYFISSTIMKCAIGFACIRLDFRPQIRYPILINMSVMVISAILALTFVFANCKPFAATWNPSLGSCQKVISLETVSYIISAIQCATDWTCAIIPWFIVAHLQMPRRRKISVLLILGLGALASIATLIRMPYLRFYDTEKYPTEFLYHVGAIVLCSNAECSLGIIACSLPPLRKLFKFYYEASQEEHTEEASNTNGSIGTKLNSLTARGKYYNPGQVRPRSGEWDRIDDDTSSREDIVRHSKITVKRA